MNRIPCVPLETDEIRAQEILNSVRKAMGAVPNLISAMVQSPAVAKAYLSFSQVLGEGLLDAQLRERIALVVSEANDSHYCVSAHGALGEKVGLSSEEISNARRGTSECKKAEAALQFAGKVVEQRGKVTDRDLKDLRGHGYGDGEVAEIIAHVALNTFTNYFNHVAGTENDFPLAAPLAG